MINEGCNYNRCGPIGLACGIEAKKHTLDYLIFDKGCLLNSLYNYPMNMTFFNF